MKYVTTIGGKEYNVEILDKGHVSINDKIVEVDFRSIGGQPVYSLLIDGKSYEAFIDPEEDEWQVLLLGQQYPVKVEDAREKRLKAEAGARLQTSGEFQLKAPMPGSSGRDPGGRESADRKRTGAAGTRIDENAE